MKRGVNCIHKTRPLGSLPQCTLGRNRKMKVANTDGTFTYIWGACCPGCKWYKMADPDAPKLLFKNFKPYK